MKRLRILLGLCLMAAFVMSAASAVSPQTAKAVCYEKPGSWKEKVGEKCATQVNHGDYCEVNGGGVKVGGCGALYYGNATKIKEGKKVPIVGWGTLTLTSAGGTVTCHTSYGGYVENPVGEPPGSATGIAETQTFATYECSQAECPQETRVEAFKLPWQSELEEPEEGVIRSASTGIDVTLGCWSGPPSGPGNTSTSERGTPVLELLPFSGESTPKLKNGITAGKPSTISFGAGSGELQNGTVGGAKTTGGTTLLGYTEQELITAH